MPAVTTPTASAQASVVDLLFAQQPERRGESRHGVATRDRDPLSTGASEVSYADGVIASELALERDSHAFARQTRKADGQAQFSEARSSFNDALQQAAAARAQRNQANAAQPNKPAQSQATEQPPKGESPPANAEQPKAKTPPDSARGLKQSTEKPTPQPAEANQQRALAQAATRGVALANDPTPQTQTPRTTPTQAVTASSAATSVTSVNNAPAASSTNNVAGNSGPPAVTATRPASASAETRDASKPAPNAPRQANDPAPFERILRFVKLQTNKEHASATLRLDPPELGRIRVEMDVQAETLRMKIDPQSDLAHRMLSENADTLRRALEASGVRVAELEIRPTPEGQSAAKFDADEGSTETRPQHESRGDSDRQASEDESEASRQGGVDSSQAEVAEAAAQRRVWQETLIDVQA